MKERQQTRRSLLRPKVLMTCLILFMATAHAAPADKKISLNFQSAQVETVLNEIQRQSELNFVYSAEQAKAWPKVSITATQKPALEVIDQLTSLIGCTYELKGNIVTITRQRGTGLRNVNGRVIGTDGEPLIGATVKVKNTNAGTITDAEGRFTISRVSSDDMLLFSYIGKKTIQRRPLAKTMIIVLEDDESTFDDVVVTGYQTISKERSAGSYDIIKGAEIEKKFLTANSVIDGLEGLTTGLAVTRNKYQDKYLIRGTTSINSERAPLFVVDGVPMESSVLEEMVNSNDVASITVLKDATAASIWGAQAANGVIVITTKKGSYNSNVKVSYSGSITSYGKPDYDYYDFMDNETFMKNAQEMFDIYSDVYAYNIVQMSTSGAISNGSYHNQTPVIWPHERLMYQYKNGEITQAQRDAGLAALVAQNGRSQYEDIFMSNKFFTQHNVNVSGGNQKSKYYLSLGYKGDQGIYKDWTNRININAYQDYQITKWLKWDVTLNVTFNNKHAHLNPFSERNSSGMGGRMFVEDAYNEFASAIEDFSYNYLPYQIFQDANGWIDQSPYVVSAEQRKSAETTTGMDLSFYPIDDFYNSVNKNNSTNLRVNTGLTANLFKGLRYEGRFQYSRINRKIETFRPQDTYYVRFEKTVMYNSSTGKFRTPETGGNFGLSNTIATDWTLRNQLVYDNTFGGKHQLTGLAGTEIRSYKTTSYNNYIRGYNMQTMQAVNYDIYALANGFIMPVTIGYYGSVRSTTYEQTETAKKYFSLYANGAYTYLGRYTLNASMRIDQSNLFGSDPSNQYKPIWAVGAAWKISDEVFMKDITWINELKLRTSFGFAGNSPLPGTGGKYDILEATNDSRYPGPGYNIATPANKKLTWEKTRVVNVGFDMRLLGNRLTLSFDYYNKYTTDLIGTLMLNPTTGWLSTIGNLGEMSNRGVEININSRNIKSRDLNWYTILTLSHNKNKIQKIEVEQAYTLATDMITATYVQGYPMGTIFSYRYAGLDERGYPQAYDKDGNIVKGADINFLTPDDVVYSGTTIPKITGGLTNRFSYKNLELSFLLSYSFGNKMRQDGATFVGRVGGGLKNELDKRWRQSGDELTTDIPAYLAMRDADYITNPFLYADTRVLNASYIKMRDISLTYTLPTSLTRKIHTANISLTAQVGNLFIIPFNSEGIDPEYFTLGYSSYYSRHEKFGPSYSFGLNINF